MKRCTLTITAAVLLALAPLAVAQDLAANPGQSLVVSRLSTSFTNLAGSRGNAVTLVTALRTGTEVTLLAAPEGGTGDPVATTFTPPTRPMGWGNVSHSLSLAQASLARLGITNPTNAELQAALLGGEVTASDGSVATLDGILQMRADGMGWGAIARSSGTTMGAVVSSTRAMQGKAPATISPATGEAAASTTGRQRPSGITTASGSGTPGAGGKASRGITTAGGGSVSQGRGPSKGVTTASGAASTSASRGLVTADGSLAGHGRSGNVTTAASGSSGGGNAYGRGLVTASGGSVGAGAASAAAHGRGAGVVSATGASAGSGASITAAAGPGNGNGQGGGNGNGHGRGRGG